LVPEGGAVQSGDDFEQGDMKSVAVTGNDGAVALTLASRELSADQLSDLAESAAVAEDGRVMIAGTPATSIAELSPSDLPGEGSTPVSYQRLRLPHVIHKRRHGIGRSFTASSRHR
jgi:hypothetical protein